MEEDIMETSGLNHIRLTIGDYARSRAFYSDVLGFELKDIGGTSSFYFAAGSVLIFCVPSEQPVPDDRFSEFRVGLDHLSFTAPSREWLDEMAARLKANDVDTQGVEQFAPTGNWYIAFRDPDNIQLEFWLPR
jgi:catechol 2,3-dioxygenase-like lactoylglutathione lyase family enzyme